MDAKKRIVFYSYKGGTGRTLALANVASYLARFEFKVCIIDMDLEAPGIHYKFLKKTDTRVKSMRGVVDYFDYYAREKAPPPDIEPYLLCINDNISIMPSGDVTCDDYWDKLSRINWHELLYEEDSSGVKLLLDLLGRIQSKELGFDYVLIDARSGITPLSGLCVSVFGDVVATFFSASPESLDGTRQMLKNIRRTREKDNLPEIPIITVLTRFEKFDNNDDEVSFLAEKSSFLIDDDNLPKTKLCVIHADREIERNERIICNSREDTVGDQLQTEVPILFDYFKFFSNFVDDEIMSSRINSLLKKITSTLSLINEPEKVQSEVEAISSVYKHKLILEELIKVYRVRNINLFDKDKFLSSINHYYDVGGAEKFVDEWYFETFLHYYDNMPFYGNKIGFLFNFEKIFEYAKNAPSRIKMQLAKLLQNRYGEEHYQKAFEFYSELLQSEQYADNATKGIMELFVSNSDLYRENSELLPDLNESLLKGSKNLELRAAVYNVFIRYCLPERADELLTNPDVLNDLKQNMPLKLIDIYLEVGYTDESVNLARTLVALYVRNQDFWELKELVGKFQRKGLQEAIDPFLPKNNRMVQDVLRPHLMD